jgi:hypothetical protein
VAPCGSVINRRFGATCRLHKPFLARVISSTLRLEATRYSETSAYNRSTRRHIPEGGILRTRVTSIHLPSLWQRDHGSSGGVASSTCPEGLDQQRKAPVRRAALRVETSIPNLLIAELGLSRDCDVSAWLIKGVDIYFGFPDVTSFSLCHSRCFPLTSRFS